MRPIAIRGAITAENNTAEEIKQASVQVVKSMVEKNNIKEDDIIMVFVTMTSDLTAFNSSAAIRQGMGWKEVPFFTSQEPEIDGSLEKCVRILLQCHSDIVRSEVQHIYLGQAANLRPDLIK